MHVVYLVVQRIRDIVLGRYINKDYYHHHHHVWSNKSRYVYINMDLNILAHCLIGEIIKQVIGVNVDSQI